MVHLTTTPTIEGKRITAYRGIVAGEAVLGAVRVDELLAFGQEPFELPDGDRLLRADAGSAAGVAGAALRDCLNIVMALLTTAES